MYQKYYKELKKNIDYYTNDENEIPLEDQISAWENNDYNLEKTKHIILGNDIQKSDVIIDNHVYNDVEFFDTHDNSTNNSVFSSLSKNIKTIYGKHILEHILKNPTTSIPEIKNRQWIIKYFLKNKDIYTKTNTLLQNITNPSKVFWLWKDVDENSKTLYEILYFKLPFIGDYINSSESILAANISYKMFVSPFFNIMTPVLSFIVPYILLRKYGINISFTQLFYILKKFVFSVSFVPTKTKSMALLSGIIWFAMYFYNIYTIINVSILTNNITNIIHDNLRISSKILFISKE